jgi:hypothetical protein
LTFRQFVTRSVSRDNPRGDLVQDLKSDSRLPTHFDSWDSFEGYLYSRRACDGALVAARAYWREYKRYQRSVLA